MAATASGLFSHLLFSVCRGQNWQSAIDLHNQYRQAHCAPSLIWNAQAAQFAQATAEKLCPTGTLQHSNAAEQPVPMGENLFLSYDAGDIDTRIAGAIEAWYSEVSIYSFVTPGFSMATGHFTQLVWSSTASVGCGAALCTSNGVANALVLSCNYVEPGNVEGSFQNNVFANGPACSNTSGLVATETLAPVIDPNPAVQAPSSGQEGGLRRLFLGKISST